MDDKRLNELWSKNEDTLIRILKYLKRYKNGRVFDDVFAEISKSTPNLTMAYVLSLIEILKEKKFLTYSMRNEIIYYIISETAIDFLSVKNVKKEIKKDKTNANENIQYVADCLKEIEDFKNKIALLIIEKEKNLIAETNNKIASLKLEKEEKGNYLNSLGFFAFSQKNNTKHEIEKIDSMIASLKAESNIAQTVGLWSQKAEKLVTKYESDMKKYLNNKYSVPFNSFPVKVDYSKPKNSSKSSVTTKSNARKPTAVQTRYTETALEVLNYLKVTKKKLTIFEMINQIPCLIAIENCTPEYVMAFVRPLHNKGNGIISRTEIDGAAYFYYDGPTVKPEELYDVMTPYEIDEKFAHLEKPELPNINSIFN